jgi:hypothetical protein
MNHEKIVCNNMDRTIGLGSVVGIWAIGFEPYNFNNEKIIYTGLAL